MADYVMTNNAAKIDEIIDFGVKNNVNTVMTGTLETPQLKTPLVMTDQIVTQDGLNGVDVTVLAEINLYNLATGNLPVADPAIAGRLWNNAGVVTVSAG